MKLQSLVVPSVPFKPANDLSHTLALNRPEHMKSLNMMLERREETKFAVFPAFSDTMELSTGLP